jgi:cation/acetate symporter
LSTADGLLLTIANVLSHDVYHRLLNPGASPIRRVMLSKVLVLVVALAAAWVASLRIGDILQFVSTAFSLAASAFFPALTLGVFWRRANRAGAVAGMLAGLGLCIGYMALNLPAARRFFGVDAGADHLWWSIEPVSAGLFGVPLGFAVIAVVSWFTAEPLTEQGWIDRVRFPGPDET